MAIRRRLKASIEHALVRLPQASRPGDRLILAYHNVVPSGTSPGGDKPLHIGISDFERQLDHIREESQVVPLMDLLTRDSPGVRRVAITFDDAYASALRLGVAACLARQLPLTVFVAPALFSTIPPWDVKANLGAWSDKARHSYLVDERGLTLGSPAVDYLNAGESVLRIASEEEVLAVSTNKLVRFGNHTMRHPNLAQLSEAEATRELLEAQEWLESRLPAAHDRVVAYPYGLGPVSASEILAAARLDFGLVVDGGWIRHKSELNKSRVPRWNVPASISSAGFRLRLRGHFTK
jgi:peptidoglycan/xylan/chitin deacetylase (PgdA/CDA1 family)